MLMVMMTIIVVSFHCYVLSIDGQCEVAVLKTEDSLDVGDASCDLPATESVKVRV